MGAARRSSWLAVIIFLGAAYFAGAYAARTLTINTDTGDMLATSLDFQQRADELNQAFPESKNGLTIIIKAAIADEAENFANQLASRLKNDGVNYDTVFAASGEPFLRENALMFLDERNLEQHLSKLNKATSLIEALTASPSAGTLFQKLTEYDEPARRSDLGADTLSSVYDELTIVAAAVDAGEFQPMSWINIVDDEDEQHAVFHLQLVNVLPTLEPERSEPAKSAIEAINRELETLKADYGGRVETFVTGGPALRGEELRSVLRGITVSLAISVVFVFGLLFLAFRSVFLTVLSFTSLAITIIFTSAFAAFAVGELNLLSTAFTVLLVGLGLDFAIHLLLHVEERRAAGQSTEEAIKGSVHEVGPAMAIAAPTTALAFFSFLPTSFSGIADLGLIAGVGVIIAFFVSVTFLPAALSAFPRFNARRSSGYIRSGFRVVDRIAIPVALLTLGLVIYAVRYLPDVRLDADPMALRDPGVQSVQGFDLLLDSDDAAPYKLTYLAGSEEEARAVAKKALTLDVVDDAQSLIDFIPDQQDEKLELIDFAAGPLSFALSGAPSTSGNSDSTKHIIAFRDSLRTAPEDETSRRLADALTKIIIREDQSSLVHFERAIFYYWPQFVSRLRDQLKADYIEMGSVPSSLRNQYISAEGLWRVDISPADDVRDDAALKRFVNNTETVIPEIAGGAIQSLKAGEEVAKAMMKATTTAIIVIGIVLFILIRRLPQVLFIMTPLMLALILTISTGVFLGIPFNFANVIVLPLLIGIGVDSGIHIVLRQRQVAAGETLFGTSTPRAVLFSALTTVASFSSLILLSHRGLSSLGAMLTIAIVYTLVCMLIVLPALLKFTSLRLRFDGTKSDGDIGPAQ